MKTAIITSTQDSAGMNIKTNLIDNQGFEKTEESYDDHDVYQKDDIKLYTTDKNSIECEGIDNEIDADLFVFATKHRSVSGIPSLSCHTPGNWSNADFGGKTREVCIASAAYLKETYLELNNVAENLGFEIVNEVTHHGPLIDKPCFFIEIGSKQEEWDNHEAGKAIAEVIVNVLQRKPKKYKVGFGIGGLHTCPEFNKVILRTDIALGHICPKYMLSSLDEDMVKKAIKRTKEKVEFAVLDWKGLAGEKKRIVEMLDRLKIKYKRTDQLLK